MPPVRGRELRPEVFRHSRRSRGPGRIRPALPASAQPRYSSAALPAWARGEQQGPRGTRRTARVPTRSSAFCASAASVRLGPASLPYALSFRSPWIRRAPSAPRETELQAWPGPGPGLAAALGKPASMRLRRSWRRASASPPSRIHRQVRALGTLADAAASCSRLQRSGSRDPAGGPAGVAGRSSRRRPCSWTGAGPGTPHGAGRSPAGSRGSASHSRRPVREAPRNGDASRLWGSMEWQTSSLLGEHGCVPSPGRSPDSWARRCDDLAAFPSRARDSGVRARVPIYSGGTAPDFHRFPCYPVRDPGTGR